MGLEKPKRKFLLQYALWCQETNNWVQSARELFQSVQSLSRVRLYVTQRTAACQASLSVINSRSLLKLIHWVGDAIQSTYPLLSPSPPAFNLSQHQGLFQWVSSSHQVAKVLEFQLQHKSFQWIFRTDFFRMDWLDSLLSKGLSWVFSSNTVWKQQFLGTQPFWWSNSHICMQLLEKS